jgi:hypothetical protein
VTSRLANTTAPRISKALLSILSRSIPPALTATLTAALAPPWGFMEGPYQQTAAKSAGGGAAERALGAAAQEACTRCGAAGAGVDAASSAVPAACRYCALARGGSLELVGKAAIDNDAAAHHYATYYAEYYARYFEAADDVVPRIPLVDGV